MVDKEKIPEFISNVDKLTAGERADLRRCAGKRYSEATGNAIAAFMKSLPREVPEYMEDIWFAALCFRCIWKDEKGNIPFEEALRLLEGNGIEKRFISLLDEDWNDDSLINIKLYRLMKQLHQNGQKPDFELFLRDLMSWNNTERYVQKRWARRYFKEV